jgi:RND family efflux transporter MFP subunit
VVRSEIAGTVAAVLVTEWVPVHRGDVLARLDPRELDAALAAARADVARAEAAQARAERELARGERLKAAGLATQQQLDDARTEHQASGATVEAARAQLACAQSRADKVVLRAPLDGVVAHRGIDVGDYVQNMGEVPLFRIVDNRLLDLTVTVPAARSALIRVGQRLTFSTEALPDRTFTGTVSYVNPLFDESSRTLKVIAEVPNEDRTLRGGLFVSGRIEVGRRAGILQLPREALQTWNTTTGQAELFVVDGDVARRLQVRVGDAAAGRVEILEGLTPGARVVVRGAFNLRDGDRVRVTGGEA